MKFDKLVRDNIPEIIKANGDTPITHVADEQEYKEKLHKKLQEETDEFLKDAEVKELADILEVIYALGELYGSSREDLEELRRQKAEERGGFSARIILDETH